jgi:hypothetical protein
VPDMPRCRQPLGLVADPPQKTPEETLHRRRSYSDQAPSEWGIANSLAASSTSAVRHSSWPAAYCRNKDTTLPVCPSHVVSTPSSPHDPAGSSVADGRRSKHVLNAQVSIRSPCCGYAEMFE